MVLPHSPGQTDDLASMAKSDNGSSGQNLIKKLVAGRNPFSSSARRKLDTVEVPPRTTSLSADTGSSPSHRSQLDSVEDRPIATASQPRLAHTEPDVVPRSNSGLPPPPIEKDEERIAASTETTSLRQDSTPSTSRQSGVNAIEQQRQDLVGQVVQEARQNKKAPLDEAGREIFEAAGFSDRIGAKGDVEVDTRWLKPVIQVSPFSFSLFLIC